VTSRDRIRALALRGAVAASGVARVEWPDGISDDLSARWDALPPAYQQLWAALARTVSGTMEELGRS
jgi:hypothetical protein